MNYFIFVAYLSLSLFSYGNLLIDPKSFDIILKCHFEDGDIKIDLIKNTNDVPFDEIKDSIPMHPDKSTWYILRHEVRGTNNEVIVSYNKIIEATEIINYSIKLPGDVILAYSVNLNKFDQYLRGAVEWTWEPKLIGIKP